MTHHMHFMKLYVPTSAFLNLSVFATQFLIAIFFASSLSYNTNIDIKNVLCVPIWTIQLVHDFN